MLFLVLEWLFAAVSKFALAKIFTPLCEISGAPPYVQQDRENILWQKLLKISLPIIIITNSFANYFIQRGFIKELFFPRFLFWRKSHQYSSLHINCKFLHARVQKSNIFYHFFTSLVHQCNIFSSNVNCTFYCGTFIEVLATKVLKGKTSSLSLQNVDSWQCSETNILIFLTWHTPQT